MMKLRRGETLHALLCCIQTQLVMIILSGAVSINVVITTD